MAPPDVEIILLKQLASCLAVPMFVTNPVGDLIYFNESYELVIGHRFDEMGPMGIDEWPSLLQMTDELGAPLKDEARAVPAALATRALAHRRYWLRTPDGQRREIEGTGIPLIGEHGRLLGALGLFWDLGADPLPGPPGEAHAGQHEVEVILMRRLASYLAVPIFIVDAIGGLLYFNRAAEPILGARFADIAAEPILELYAAFQPSEEDGTPIEHEEHPLWSARLERKPAHRNLLIRGLDGVQRGIEIAAIPLVGQSERMLGVAAFFWERTES